MARALLRPPRTSSPQSQSSATQVRHPSQPSESAIRVTAGPQAPRPSWSCMSCSDTSSAYRPPASISSCPPPSHPLHPPARLLSPPTFLGPPPPRFPTPTARPPPRHPTPCLFAPPPSASDAPSSCTKTAPPPQRRSCPYLFTALSASPAPARRVGSPGACRARRRGRARGP